MGGRIGV
jgi:hypothetical protein